MAHVQALLPRNLEALAKLAAKGDQLRYGQTTGIQLTVKDDTYTAAATDGRTLGIVTGPVGDVSSYPTWPALDSAPNSGTQTVISAKEWTAALKAVPHGRKTGNRRILERCAVVIGEKGATLGSTDLGTTNLAQPQCLEGRFPDWTKCWTGKMAQAPAVTFSIDPALMIPLLQAAQAIMDDEGKRATISVWDANSPVQVESANADGQKFKGLIVPLVAQGDTVKAPKRGKKERSPRDMRQEWPNVFKAIARLAVVMHRCHGDTLQSHPDLRNRGERIGNRARAALAALTAKYLA